MNPKIWNGIGHIGDDLITYADESTVRNHFKRKKRNHLIKYTGLAACVCLVVCLCITFIRNDVPNGNDKAESFGGSIYITEPGRNNGAPSLPWSDVLAYSLTSEKSVYLPTEQPIFTLRYGLKSDMLGNGSLKIGIHIGDFRTTAQTEITVNDFTYPAYSGREANAISIPLVPPEDDSFGTITIGFLFYPENPEEYAGYLSDGALPIGNISLSYVKNKYELVLSQINAYDLFEIRLVKLYEAGTIEKKEFADRYFAFVYRDTVCASVSVINSDGSYCFFYRSKNIRYDSPYITDPEIKNAMDSENESLIVRLALNYLLTSGVITQTEYDSELAWIAEAKHVGMYDIVFDQNVAKYAHKVLQKNMYTHK